MPWRPRDQAPAHDLDRYSYRIAVLMSSDGRLAGHLLVLPNAYWQRSRGHLWWRQWHKPIMAADVLFTLPDQDPAPRDFYWGDGVHDVVRLWDQGMIVDCGVEYTLIWLDANASRQVAASAFSVDLDQERLARS